MTPLERRVLLSTLITIRTCIINMENNKTDYNDIACLDEMAVALDYCIDTFENANY